MLEIMADRLMRLLPMLMVRRFDRCMVKTATIPKHPKLDGDHLWRLQISGQRGAGFNMGVSLWQLAHLACPKIKSGHLAPP